MDEASVAVSGRTRSCPHKKFLTVLTSLSFSFHMGKRRKTLLCSRFQTNPCDLLSLCSSLQPAQVWIVRCPNCLHDWHSLTLTVSCWAATPCFSSDVLCLAVCAGCLWFCCFQGEEFKLLFFGIMLFSFLLACFGAWYVCHLRGFLVYSQEGMSCWYGCCFWFSSFALGLTDLVWRDMGKTCHASFLERMVPGCLSDDVGVWQLGRLVSCSVSWQVKKHCLPAKNLAWAVHCLLALLRSIAPKCGREQRSVVGHSKQLNCPSLTQL